MASGLYPLLSKLFVFYLRSEVNASHIGQSKPVDELAEFEHEAKFWVINSRVVGQG